MSYEPGLVIGLASYKALSHNSFLIKFWRVQVSMSPEWNTSTLIIHRDKENYILAWNSNVVHPVWFRTCLACMTPFFNPSSLSQWQYLTDRYFGRTLIHTWRTNCLKINCTLGHHSIHVWYRRYLYETPGYKFGKLSMVHMKALQAVRNEWIPWHMRRRTPILEEQERLKAIIRNLYFPKLRY